MHGNKDEIIPIKAGRTASEILLGRGHPIHFEKYDAPHKIPLNKMKMMGEFIDNPLKTIKMNNKNLLYLNLAVDDEDVSLGFANTWIKQFSNKFYWSNTIEEYKKILQ